MAVVPNGSMLYACIDCVKSYGQALTTPGTTMYRWGDGFGGKEGMRIIQPGILDDKGELDNLRPALEMFIEDRVKWISAVEGLAQHEGMPPP